MSYAYADHHHMSRSYTEVGRRAKYHLDTQPPHQMESVQIRHPTCWDPPGNRSLQDFDPYDPPPTRQPSCWEPPPHRASQGYSDYDQPPPRPPSCWDPPRHRTNRRCPPLPVRRSTCGEQPTCLEPDKSHPYQPDRNPYVSRQPRRHHLPSYQPPPNQPTDSLDWQQPYQPRRSYHPSGEPQQFDQSPSHHTTMLPAAARTRSGSVHLPQKSRKLMDSRQKRGLPNNPELMVRSLTPVQQAALDDYNEKLRIYRLEQAALLARLNAWFEENIQDENLAEEKTDNTPTIVCGDDVPNDITDVHNDGASLDVPNNESPEEFVKNEGIVKNDNESPQVLAVAYDDKIGDLVVPTHRELEITDDVGILLQENIVCYDDIASLTKSLANRKIGAIYINSKCSRSHIMFTGIIESWCGSGIHNLIHDQPRPCTFDPGGKLPIFIAS